jgi:hypothetical protein
MSKFWDKVYQCKHKNLYPDYYENVYCGTPYCSGNESHCKDCGVYIAECGCGSSGGLSGWSYERVRRWQKKKYGPEPKI